MKYSFLILFCYSLSCFAQVNVLEFNVSKPESQLIVTPEDSTFWLDKRNVLRIEIVEGKNEIAKVELSEGLVKRIGVGIYEAKFEKTGETVLRVIERKPNGKTQLAFSKPYKIIEKPKPEILVCGVAADSAVDLRHLLHVSEIQAVMETGDYKPAVLSFDMVDVLGGEEVVYSSRNNKFTIHMKNAIRQMREGRTLIFRNIRVMLPDGTLFTKEEVEVFLIESNQYSVGVRNGFGNR